MKVLKIEIWEDKRNVLIYIEYEDDFNKDDLKAKLRNQVDKNFNYEIILIKNCYSKSVDDFLHNNYDSFLEYVKFTNPIFYPVFFVKPNVVDSKLIYISSNNFIINKFNNNNVNIELEGFVKYFFNIDVNIEIVYGNQKEDFIKDDIIVENKTIDSIPNDPVFLNSKVKVDNNKY